MPLEATIIVIDNSEHSRNGDYLPTRFEAQADSVNLIFQAKTQANPESSVGLMSMGGSQPEVLTTLTTDFGKVLDGIHRTRIRGSAHFTTALNVALLALKHRQNKAQHQRIILFICSPLGDETSQSMSRLAKRMKKNNIAVDIVAFGSLEPSESQKIEAFYDAIKPAEAGSAGAEDYASHLEIIPPGPSLLSDRILSSSILGGGGNGGGGDDFDMGGGGDSGAGFEFGVDPSQDPELALALRMSMEEEERRQAREREAQAREEGRTQLDSVAEEAVDGEKKEREDKKDDEDKPGDGDKMDTA